MVLIRVGEQQRCPAGQFAIGDFPSANFAGVSQMLTRQNRALDNFLEPLLPHSCCSHLDEPVHVRSANHEGYSATAIRRMRSQRQSALPLPNLRNYLTP